MKTGIFYATSTGTTRGVAERIAKALGVRASDVYNVAKTGPDKFDDYELIILGSPTYGAGEVHDDWYDVLDAVKALDLNGKTVAVFGCGDENMSDSFCSAVGIIYKAFKDTGARMIGEFNTFPYEFDKSEAVPVQGGEAVGLLLDEVNRPEATDKRIKEWVETLK